MPGVFLLLAGRFPTPPATTSLLLCRLGNASGIHAQCLILFRSRALAGPRRCQITWPMDSETWSTAASSCRQINDQLPHSCCTASGPKALVHPCLVVKDGGTCCWYWFTLLRDSRDTKIGIDALVHSTRTYLVLRDGETFSWSRWDTTTGSHGPHLFFLSKSIFTFVLLRISYYYQSK